MTHSTICRSHEQPSYWSRALSDDRGQSTATEIDWPPTLRAELEGIQAPRRPWYITVGPAYLTIFVWAPFLDPLWRNDLAGGRLGPLAVTAIVAALACFGLFYYPAAMWGYRTGRRLGVVAASTFGTTGSEWLTGVALAVAELVWYAVAIDYAVVSTFSGLAACGLVPASILAPWHAGPFALRGPIFLCTAMFWIFITVMAGLLRLSGVIAALMKVYSPVALGLLTISAIWAMPGLAAFQPDEVRAVAPVGQSQPSYSTIPLVTGFFSLVGLMGVEWGAASARRRDVVFGGLAGILVAGSWTAVMSLIVVAGAVGRLLVARPAAGVSVPDLPQLSFRWGIMHGVGGVPAGAILILFGLAALAPACYSSFLFIRKLFARWPRVRRGRLGVDRRHGRPGAGRDDLAWPAGGRRLRHGRGVRTGGRRDRRGFHGPAGPVGGRPAQGFIRPGRSPGCSAWRSGRSWTSWRREDACRSPP